MFTVLFECTYRYDCWSLDLLPHVEGFDLVFDCRIGERGIHLWAIWSSDEPVVVSTLLRHDGVSCSKG